MDKSRKHIETLLNQAAKKREKERHRHKINRLAAQYLEMQADEKRQIYDQRLNKRKEKRVGTIEVVVAPLLELASKEAEAIVNVTDDVKGLKVVAAYKLALDKEGAKLIAAGKPVYVIDETEDYPRIVYWYDPQVRLWFDDVYGMVQDLSDLVPKTNGYRTLGDAWEQS